MAHELSFIDGVANFFEVGSLRTAWHRAGVLLPTAPDLATALDVARMDYHVDKVTTYRRDPTLDGVYHANRLAFATVRTDTGAELGAVGPTYQPLQNHDAFRVLEPLLEAGTLRIETGGVLRDGADAWLLARFDVERFGPVCREVFGDEVAPFALVSNNHSGRRNASVTLTPVRVECANTLRAVERQQDAGFARFIGVRHTKDVEARMVQAATDLFEAIIERYEVVAQDYRLLKSFYLDEAMFRSLVLDAVVEDPRAPRPGIRQSACTDRELERYGNKAGEIRRLWTQGTGHVGDDSAWEAYNAVVEALDHDEERFPSRDRTASLLHGTLARTKGRVLSNLIRAANASLN